MSYPTSESVSYSWTTADIGTVVNRFRADILMIAQSSVAITEALALEYAHDVEVLAKEGYLESVDLTLFSKGAEVRAVRYDVETEAGDLTMSRPGGVRWPKVTNPEFRIILTYNSTFTTVAEQKVKVKLKRVWKTSNYDTSHSTLSSLSGRDYVSNGWGMRRKDFNQ